jgi:hypothetical protein
VEALQQLHLACVIEIVGGNASDDKFKRVRLAERAPVERGRVELNDHLPQQPMLVEKKLHVGAP